MPCELFFLVWLLRPGTIFCLVSVLDPICLINADGSLLVSGNFFICTWWPVLCYILEVHPLQITGILSLHKSLLYGTPAYELQLPLFPCTLNFIISTQGVLQALLFLSIPSLCHSLGYSFKAISWDTHRIHLVCFVFVFMAFQGSLYLIA